MVSFWPALVGLVFASGATPTIAQAENQNNIQVTARRPVLAAIEQLRQRHGWRITYEDDPLAGDEVYSLAFSYLATSTEPLPALTKLVEAHAALGHGRFRVEKSGFGWHVIPQSGSALDAKISPRAQATSPRDVVETICSALRQESKKRVVTGRVATAPTKPIRVDGNGEQARAVLSHALQQFGVPLAWDLLYFDELEGYIVVVNRIFRVSGLQPAR